MAQSFTDPKETPNTHKQCSTLPPCIAPKWCVGFVFEDLGQELYTESRQTLGDKVQGQEGNSPDRMLRSRSNHLVEKEVVRLLQPGGGLGSSHPIMIA